MIADQDMTAEGTSKMHYIPYKGESYGGGFKHQLRLLLLGDSFNSDTWSVTAPKDVVEDNIKNGNYPFFNGLQRIVTGMKHVSAADRQSFWDKVAFTNMLQVSVETPTAVPSKVQWADAWAAFPEIIHHTMPDVIFIFSTRGWDQEGHFHAPFTGSVVTDLRPLIEGKRAAYLRDFSALEPGCHALSGCFDHPSHIQRTGKWNEWNEWANRLLDAAPGKLGRTVPTSRA